MWGEELASALAWPLSPITSAIQTGLTEVRLPEGLIFPWVSFFFFAILNRFKGDWIKGGGGRGRPPGGLPGGSDSRICRKVGNY